VAKGGEDVCDPLVEGFDASFQIFQHAEVLADQKAMIVAHVTFKRSNQVRTRAPQTFRSEGGQLLRICLASDDGIANSGPLTPTISLMTGVNLMLASSNVFCVARRQKRDFLHSHLYDGGGAPFSSAINPSGNTAQPSHRHGLQAISAPWTCSGW
jgi:hypothetical protein